MSSFGRRGFLAALAMLPFLRALPARASRQPRAVTTPWLTIPPGTFPSKVRVVGVEHAAFVTYANAADWVFHESMPVEVVERDGYRLATVEIPRGSRLLCASMGNPLPMPIVFAVRNTGGDDVFRYQVGAESQTKWQATR